METGKLVCLLAQFPYSFHFTEENLNYIKRLRQMFEGYEINVEFRNQEWIKGDVFNALKQENLGFVCVDEPGLRGLIKNVIAVTSKTAYLRFHGRNAANWYVGEGAERYNYLYSTDELSEWVSRIHELKDNSQAVLISFNNHPVGKAIQNARMLMDLL